jgi:hypothetical protein
LSDCAGENCRKNLIDALQENPRYRRAVRLVALDSAALSTEVAHREAFVSHCNKQIPLAAQHKTVRLQRRIRIVEVSATVQVD